jgi:hypothetical protein
MNLKEVDKPEVKKTVVVYSGRFQPFHSGHYISYLKLAKKFGKDNVYIATSNDTSGPKSPFNFNEKVKIITTMFGVPSDKIVQVRNPYAPKEILSSFDGKTTAYIAAVGEKDANRLSGKYFKPYNGKTGYGYDEIGYVYAVPSEKNPISGTDVRSWLGKGDEEEKKKGFLKAYPKYDKEIFNMITGKLNESVNTEPSSALRPEPTPIRHDIEHPEDEKKAFDGNSAPYDPIGEIIHEYITNELFEEFIQNYLGEAPNPIMDKEFDYTASDGKKKKITVKGALRLAKDHPAHIQASKMVGSDKGAKVPPPPPKAPPKAPPALPGKAAKQAAKPSIPGQPVKQGQTQQGKVDAAKGGTPTGKGGAEAGGAPQQVDPQKLSGAELKSKAEKSPAEKAKELAKEVAKKNVEKLKSIFKDDFTKEEEHDAHEAANPHSETRKGWGQRIGDFLKAAPSNIIKGAYDVAKQKYHQIKNTGRGIQSLAVSLSKGEGLKLGYFKDRDGQWKHSDTEAKRQGKAMWNTVKDVAVIAASVVAGGAVSAAFSHVAAGGATFSSAGHAAIHGVQHIFTGGVANATAGEMASHFVQHCAVDFAKHCGWESVFLGAGAGHTSAYVQAAGAGLVQQATGAGTTILHKAAEFLTEEEDEHKQNADMFSKMVMQTVEKLKDFKPTTKQMLDSAESYLKDKQLANAKQLVGNINENLSDSKKANIQNFVEYGTKRLKLKEEPRISFIEGEEYAHAQSSLGGYNPQTKEIYVAVEGRLTADILRTIAHEMVHRKQDEMGLVGDPVKAGADGSPVENQAHAVAGILMREYGRLNKEIYTEVSNVGTANTADVPDGAFIKKGKKRTLDADKSESWYENGGYTQTEFPKADAIFGDEDAEERTIKYTIKNLPDVEYVETDFFKEDINIDVDKGDTVLMGKFKNKKTTVKDIGTDDHGMPTINGKKATTFRIPRGEKSNSQSVFDEVGTNDWHFKAIMKLWDKSNSFGKKKIGVAVCKDPNASRRDIVVQLRDTDYEEVTDMTDKLGLKEYIEKKNKKYEQLVNEYFTTLDKYFSVLEESVSKAVSDFTKGHSDDIGLPAELDTYDFDDSRKKQAGYQPDAKDDEDYGYEPVKTEKLTQSNLDSVERYADRELDPADIEFSNHFFDRVNDTRNGKEISEPELTGFFKRLGRHKKQFIDFLEKYNQIVVKDDRSNINIPFVKMANKVIAKTVMRKGDFQTNSPTIVNEETPSEIIKDLDKVRHDLIKKVDVLIAKKKKLYSNVDIESPMSAEEKQLDKDIQSIFSQIQQIILKKRSLKESLKEGIQWEADVFTRCMQGQLPLSLNIVKKLVDPIVTKSLHVTDIANLPKVAALEGTKKSISTFNKTTKWGKIAQGKGLWTEGGVIVSLSGVVLAQSIMDLWTRPDKQGRRWVEPGTVISGLGRSVGQVFEFAPHLEPFKKRWLNLQRYETAEEKIEFTPEEKNKFIRDYFEAAEKYMLSKKKEFQDQYLNSNRLYSDVDWNEVVLTNIKIEKILVIQNKTLLQDYPWDIQKKHREIELSKSRADANKWLESQKNPNDRQTEIDKIKQKYKNVEVAKNEADIENFINNNGGKVINESVNKKVISEGGAYGHMSHPFDDMNLTFGDLKNIIRGALTGNLELTREKTDGQALAISWKNGRLIAARNKGHLQNAGANAMGIEDVASKFAGRGGLTDAYNFAMKDLSAAISGLTEAQRTKIFNEGKCFMNLEVIWPTSVNVIPYGQPLLVFHNTTCYDESGKAVGADQSAATKLAGMIKQVNADVQSKYTIQGPPVTNLPKNEELGSKQTKYITQLQRLQHVFQLSDRAGVAEYHQAWWEDFIDKSKVKLQKLEKEALIRRWAFGDKSLRLNTISDKEAQEWAIDNDRVNVAKQQKENIRPFEEIFLGVGADVLSFMSSVLTVNPDMAIRSMGDRMEAIADKVRGSGDVSKIAKLEMELNRLASIGGKDKIVPNEGIVFVYKGNTYKLTGTFAPLNQILGIFYE